MMNNFLTKKKINLKINYSRVKTYHSDIHLVYWSLITLDLFPNLESFLDCSPGLDS